MIQFTLHSTASPPDVLAALHAHAGQWRESQIPDDLRRAGIFAVECQIRGAVGILRYSPAITDRFTKLRLELRATVAADPNGGTLIEVRVGYRPVPYAALVGAVLLSVIAAWLFAATPLAAVAPVLFGGILVLNILFIRESNAALLRRERAPAYLIERLERAVVAARTPKDLTPAS